MPRFRIGARTLLSAALLLLFALPASPAAAGLPCHDVLAPGGSVEEFSDSLSSGQVGCLRAGTYREDTKIAQDGITLTAYPGERATIQGRMWVAGDRVVIEGLYLNGRNGDDLPSPSVTGDHTVFRRNDVTNQHTSICFSLGHPGYGRAVDMLIQQNRIHHCGKLPAANHDHGIYITAADDTRIVGNWIYDNADRGIQVYPDAQGSVVRGNVIDGNGQGIIFGGEGQETSNDSVVNGNVITNSKLRHNVESFYPDGTPIGRNNRVTANCVRGGARDDGDGGIGEEVGFSASGNTVANPDYVNRGGDDFRLAAGSPCRANFENADLVPGPDGLPAPPLASRRPARRLSLSASRRAVRSGLRLRLRGRLRGVEAAGARVVIVARSRGGWRRVAAPRIGADGRFATRRHLRLRQGARAVRIRAVVRGVARSRSVRLAVH